MINWLKYKLGDVIHIKHGYAFKGEYFVDEPTDNILLSFTISHTSGKFKPFSNALRVHRFFLNLCQRGSTIVLSGS